MDDLYDDSFSTIEIKASATLTAKDFTGLKRFKENNKKNFRIGLLLYDGDHTTALTDDIFAVPLGTLWS